MIIVTAVLIAHTVDLVFYTFKDSSQEADHTVAYFAIIIRILLLASLMFVFVRLGHIVRDLPLIRLKKKVWTAHMGSLLLYIVFWVAYEISYIFWVKDTNNKGLTHRRLIVLASIELVFNLSSMILEFLLFWMLDKMTRPIDDEIFNPILQRKVPLFVYLSQC